MLRAWKLLLLAVVVSGGFTFIGCGDSGPSGTVTPPAVEKTAAGTPVAEPPSTDEK